METRHLAESGRRWRVNGGIGSRNRRALDRLGWLSVRHPFQRVIKNAGMQLLVVADDGCARHYAADFIFNQRPCAVPDFYSNCDSRATQLLGARYVLLRREFLPARPANRYHALRAQKVLVTLGGADPDNCLAISAAGSTSWELAFMGLPMLVVVLAENQRLNATRLGERRGRESGLA